MAKLITSRQAKLIAKGYTSAVYQAYASTTVRRGTVASVHRTYEAALVRSRRLGGLHGVTDLSSKIACGDDIVVAA